MAEKKIPAWLLVGLMVLSCVSTVTRAQTAAPNAQDLITKYLQRTDEYAAAFKNLSAEETKYIEDIDANGTVKKHRTVVSDLLVYQPNTFAERWIAEYRSVRSVDGKALPDAEKRATKLFEDISKAKSSYDEWERVRKEWSKHDLSQTWWGFTINQAVAIKGSRPHFVFALLGQEQVKGRPTNVVFYRQVEPSQNYTGPTYLVNAINSFERYRSWPVMFVGKLWLDAETSQLHREERAMVVYLPAATASFVTYKQLREILASAQAGALKALTVARWKFEYQASEFNILTPKTIEIEFFNHLREMKEAKGETGYSPPELLLGHRTRYQYGQFKRFDVSGEETKREIIKP